MLPQYWFNVDGCFVDPVEALQTLLSVDTCDPRRIVDVRQAHNARDLGLIVEVRLVQVELRVVRNMSRIDSLLLTRRENISSNAN